MEIPIEILGLFFVSNIAISIIGIWKKIPLMMFIGGALITFIFILTDSITSLGDTQTCTTTLPSSTSCTFQPYDLDPWVKIIFMLFGVLFMIGGALIWKTIEE